ncbi:MAG TPA: Uma2 family endonuclease [Thermomicrobiales bacterium]|jgi:Uma2 family endonuclease|nr:Uma2 family endonuclease [Thermomicrobiales bacterium]
MVARQTAQTTGPHTIADYDALPDDGRRYELIDGALIEMPSPSALHQTVQVALASLLFAVVMQGRLGRVFVSPMDVYLGGMLVQPDLFYVAAAHDDIVMANRIIGAPDLIIEILSPSTRTHDLTTKRNLYRSVGVREYWTVDLEARSATVWALVGDRYVERQPDEQGHHASTVLPGFTVDVAAVIASVE